VNQRLSEETLRAWENLGYGMFIHFGMSTFSGVEYDEGNEAPEMYCPTELNAAQWVKTAADAGMKYAILTAKHVAGFCLWPSHYTDYSVQNAPVSTDVVGSFVTECRKAGIKPGLYYCAWDNHTKLGSLTPTDLGLKKAAENAFVTVEYQKYMTDQIRELLSSYGPLEEIWIDIPFVLGRGYRTSLYQEISAIQPDIKIMMNHGIGDSLNFSTGYAWPTDLISIESCLPSSLVIPSEVRTIEGKEYYIPEEVCDSIGHSWFYRDTDPIRSDEELLGMYLTARARKASFLLNVPPTAAGVIPQKYVDALLRLRRNAEMVKQQTGGKSVCR
jgi:alpha-L-fucosidase